jgi:hypothetical protein
VNRTASQENASRRVVTMEWIDRVRSTPYQTANTRARMAAQIGVVVVSGT